MKIQDQYSKAHGQNIELSKDCSTTKSALKRLSEDKQDVDLALLQLKEKHESLLIESAQLKRENVAFQKKKDDTTWVAKSEFLVLERKLKEKEKQFDRLSRELRKEMD